MDQNFIEQKKHTIIFVWKEKNSESSCRLYDKTLSEAKTIAKSFGWSEMKWYNPKTWSNNYMVFN
mgnify:CR=1 FL=1